jgi:aspartate/methionine/tyrosine aminotransferase
MLTLNDLNPHVRRTEYAVRGPIVERAQQLEAEGRRIIYCNIGNPQALRQRPSTYLRQLLSLMEHPELMDDPAAAGHFPADVIARARAVLALQPPGTGAYTQSCGLPFVRRQVAEFVAARDGIPADAAHVILTDGASRAIEMVLLALIGGPHTGIMIPVPQYPLYSAAIALYGGRQVDYAIDEDTSWQLSDDALEHAIRDAREGGIRPAAIVVINPGNPTGAVLTADNIAMIVRFARRHGIAILADEVYQENVYAEGRRFVSFAKVMHDLGERDVSLFSFHSVSKGFLGECGHRGGYVECRNVPDDVVAELAKLQSVYLCPNVPGQLAVSVMVAPPTPGDASHAAFMAERAAILDGLKAKAEILERGINAIEGMSLVRPEGAMYGFVRFELPDDPGVDVARMSAEEQRRYEAGRDSAYCLALLEETGICVVPGSGFGQQPGTFHFRTTFLPPAEEIEALVERLMAFHERYVRRKAGAGA